MWSGPEAWPCPAASATPSDRSTGVGTRSTARAPVSERPPQAHAGPLHRADGGQAHPQALAPPGVEAALGDQGARPPSAVERDQPEGLGGAELVGQVGGQGAGAPVDRPVAAHHQVGRPERAGWRPPACGPGRARPRPARVT